MEQLGYENQLDAAAYPLALVDMEIQWRGYQYEDIQKETNAFLGARFGARCFGPRHTFSLGFYFVLFNLWAATLRLFLRDLPLGFIFRLGRAFGIRLRGFGQFCPPVAESSIQALD